MRVRRIVPTDERQAIVQAVRPPPVSGGTLLVTANAVIASDPDRDRISIVDLASFRLRTTLPLEAGDEPGRLVEGKNGQVHVALRGSGQVLTIDPVQGQVVSRTPVCGEPRGLAFEATRSLLLVACAEGSLVELDGTAVVKRTSLGPDLRDVVIRGGDVLVSRFRSASILKLDTERKVISETRPPSVLGLLPARQNSDVPFEPVTAAFEPSVAWRMVATASGAMMIHQRATTAVVDIDAGNQNNESSPYGGGSTCEGIVQPALTKIDAQGTVVTAQGGLSAAVLPVDVAVSPDGSRIAVASAGSADPLAPVPSIVTQSADGSSAGAAVPPASRFAGSVTVVRSGSVFPEVSRGEDTVFGCTGTEIRTIPEPTIAVAFDATGQWLFAQTREPSKLFRISVDASALIEEVELFGASRLDTGHELFHRDGGAGIACASCHPEGGEDGHVWHFNVTGERRTQALNVGLADTAPFHWDGDLKDVGSLMKEVFVGRMNGVFQSQPRIDALSGYLFGLPAPRSVRSPDDLAAIRGKAVFESAETGCATCHSGPKLTNNLSVAIGKGKALQVPTLIGIARRAPFLHDGCAATLAERFDPSCGGQNHGDVSRLTPDALGDMIAYLESL